jgi:hypothetical protein
VLHRDLKPANVMIDGKGSRTFSKHDPEAGGAEKNTVAGTPSLGFLYANRL